MPGRKGIATSADGVQIHYEVFGQGAPALVFIHGGLSKRTQWHNQADHFSRRFTVVTVDLAGHGESGVGRESWTMQAFGEDVVAVVEHLGIDRVVLVGHSMGGVVMLEAAVGMPQKVIGLIGVDTLQRIDTTGTAEQAEEFFGPLREDFAAAVEKETRIRFLPESDPVVLQQVLNDVAEMRTDVGLAEMEDLFSPGRVRRTSEILPMVTAPISVIAPDWRPFDVDIARRRGIEVKLVSGTGHWIQMELPETLNAFIERKVAGFEARESSKP